MPTYETYIMQTLYLFLKRGKYQNKFGFAIWHQVRRQNFFPIIFNGTLEPLCFCALIGISTWINDNFKIDAFTQCVQIYKFIKIQKQKLNVCKFNLSDYGGINFSDSLDILFQEKLSNNICLKVA